jgi:hypothetical protein
VFFLCVIYSLPLPLFLLIVRITTSWLELKPQ